MPVEHNQPISAEQPHNGCQPLTEVDYKKSVEKTAKRKLTRRSFPSTLEALSSDSYRSVDEKAKTVRI